MANLDIKTEKTQFIHIYSLKRPSDPFCKEEAGFRNRKKSLSGGREGGLRKNRKAAISTSAFGCRRRRRSSCTNLARIIIERIEWSSRFSGGRESRMWKVAQLTLTRSARPLVKRTTHRSNTNLTTVARIYLHFCSS